MNENINNRVLQYAHYIIDNNSTIRRCANNFGVGKSSVHFDLKYRLPHINLSLYNQVVKILIKNFEEKHLRGGEATKKKYLNNSSTNSLTR